MGPAAPHRANRHPMSSAPTAPLQNCVQALLALYCLILQLIKAGRGCGWQDPFVTTRESLTASLIIHAWPHTSNPFESPSGWQIAREGLLGPTIM